MQRIAAIVLLLVCAASANAATFTVTSSADSGAGTLRDAILQANALPGRDKIRLTVIVKPTAPLPASTMLWI